MTEAKLMLTVEFDGVAPPVPATERIVYDGGCLRIDNDDVV